MFLAHENSRRMSISGAGMKRGCEEREKFFDFSEISEESEDLGLLSALKKKIFLSNETMRMMLSSVAGMKKDYEEQEKFKFSFSKVNEGTEDENSGLLYALKKHLLQNENARMMLPSGHVVPSSTAVAAAATNSSQDLGQLLQGAEHRWLLPVEICEILCNHQKFQLASAPPFRPPDLPNNFSFGDLAHNLLLKSDWISSNAAVSHGLMYSRLLLLKTGVFGTKCCDIIVYLLTEDNGVLWMKGLSYLAAGTVLLLDRNLVRYFRKDGHQWRQKRNGRIVELRGKLKAGGPIVLHCCYSLGADNENFQRRSYWMLDEQLKHIVLVHYRDLKKEIPHQNSLHSNVQRPAIAQHLDQIGSFPAASLDSVRQPLPEFSSSSSSSKVSRFRKLLRKATYPSTSTSIHQQLSFGDTFQEGEVQSAHQNNASLGDKIDLRLGLSLAPLYP